MRPALKWILAVVTGALVPGVATAAEEEVVELPPLEVISPGRPLPPWQYASLGHVEVLSRCSSALTREFIETHGRLTQLLHLLLPPELQVKMAAPQIIILTDQTTTPAAARDAVLGFSATSRPPERVPTAREQQIRFVPNLRLNDADEVAIYAILDTKTFSGDRLMLTANHVRDVLERRTPPLPAWFIAGVLILYRDVHYQHDALEFAPLDWVSAEETENLRRDAEYPRTLLPLRELFAGTPARESPDGAAAERLWQVQAALLVRWALEGEDRTRRAGFWRLVERAALAPVDEGVLRECLGLSHADLRDRLSDSLPGMVRNRLRVRAEKIVPVPPFKLQNATPAEIGRLKGEWERMEINYVKARYPQYTDKYALQAHRTLTEAYAKGGTDPRLLAVVGLYECEVGNGEAARSYLEEAARAKVVRPRVYVELARLRYTEAKAGLADENQRLSAVQANRVLEPLATAWTQAPPLAEAYTLAAEVWVNSLGVLDRPQFGLLEEGCRLFPRHLPLPYYTALLKGLHGDRDGAETMITRGLETFSTVSARTRFEQLREWLRRRDLVPARR